MRCCVFAALMCASGAINADVPSPADLTKARDHVGEWHMIMLDTEMMVATAYLHGDTAKLYKVFIDLTDLNTYTSRMGEQKYWGNKPFWAGDAAAVGPYAPCQTAMMDLALVASASEQALRDPNTITKKILVEEQEDYAKSKGRCELRLAMPPAQAWTEYEAE